jgi:hypothetical protein
MAGGFILYAKEDFHLRLRRSNGRGRGGGVCLLVLRKLESNVSAGAQSEQSKQRRIEVRDRHFGDHLHDKHENQYGIPGDHLYAVQGNGFAAGDVFPETFAL